MKPLISRLFLVLLLLAVAAVLVTGCKTDDADNASSRPWNVPKTWEHGVPMGIYEGR